MFETGRGFESRVEWLMSVKFKKPIKRINFLDSTKKILAGRAAYQCSHPNCEVVTIGPGENFDQINSIGEAAHIYSASENGPRGQNGLSEADLKSIKNGIWMCKNHARLIDTNSGDGFTADQLKAWKYLHEESIKKTQGRISRNIGWLKKKKQYLRHTSYKMRKI